VVQAVGARCYVDPPFRDASGREPVAERFVIRSDDLGYEPVDDEMLVIDFVTSDYFLLNATGAAAWRAFAEPRTTSEIAAAFAGTDGDARDAIAHDLDAFCSSLAADGLLVRVDDATPDPAADVIGLAAPYVVPRYERFGTLERLMLAGE
jgi:hypothetical protein